MSCCCICVEPSRVTPQDGPSQGSSKDDTSQGTSQGTSQIRRPDLIVRILGSLSQTRLPTWPDVKFYNTLIHLLETASFSKVLYSDSNDRNELKKITTKLCSNGRNSTDLVKILELKCMTDSIELDEEDRQWRFQPLEGSNFTMRIPYVSIVVGNTICSTLNDVKQSLDDNIPVILIRGSGVTADIISKCLKISDTVITGDVTKTKFNGRKFERAILPLLTESGIRRDDVYDTLKEICRNKLLIGQVDIASTGHEALTETSLKLVHRARMKEKLENREQEYFQQDHTKHQGELSRWVVELAFQDDEVSKDENAKKILFCHALLGDMYDIVEALMKSGVNLEELDFKPLYSKFFKKKKEYCCNFREDNETENPWRIRDKRYMIEDIIQEYIMEEADLQVEDCRTLSLLLCNRILSYDSFLKRRRIFGCKENPLVYCLRYFFFPYILCYCSDFNNSDNREKIDGADCSCQKCPCVIHCPFGLKVDTSDNTVKDDLLLWAVLTNNRQMADIFWRLSSRPIFLALFSCAVLEKMRKRAICHKESELAKELKVHSRLFCNRAIQVTDQLYDMDPNLTLTFLTKHYVKYVLGYNEIPLQFARKYEIYDFLASEVAQKAMDRLLSTPMEPWFYGGECITNKSACMEKIGNCLSKQFRNVCTTKARLFIHYVIYFAFLFCLSALVLTNQLQTDSVHGYETFVRFWIVADMYQEFVPDVMWLLFHVRPEHLTSYYWIQIKSYCSSLWNWMNIAAYIAYWIGAEYRNVEGKSEQARTAYSILLFIIYFRCLNPLLMFRKQGEALIMLQNALGMLLRYIPMLLTFIVSTGVFYHANLYPAHYDMFSPFGIQHWSFWKIFYLPYWQMYGDFKPELDGEGPAGCSYLEYEYSTNATIDRCPEKNWMVPVMSSIFFLLVHVVFLNLIIALFSFRFSKIKKNAKRYWRFHRSVVIMDFEHRLPVPTNLFVPFIKFIHFLCVARLKDKEKILSTFFEDIDIPELQMKQETAARLCYDNYKVIHKATALNDANQHIGMKVGNPLLASVPR